ncbi:MAG: F0F1 ATP synthase subunit epsilon [Candidatus Omnitrophica bacterium]|nr:F0F1 ATP synthase subunit epsilon [Candidatus Omnitrophota bacterium]
MEKTRIRKRKNNDTHLVSREALLGLNIFNMINVLFLTPQRVLFEGQCKSIILPGEEGMLEVLSFHKDFLSRLLPGIVEIDSDLRFAIRRGIVKIERNTAIIIAESMHWQQKGA